MTPFKLPLAVGATTLLISSTVIANDARSIALGGSAITLGGGVHGVFANPATLMHLNRQNKNVHLRLGAGVDFRDSGDLIDSAFDTSEFVNDIDAAIDTLANTPISCITLDISLDTVCLSNTAELGQDFEGVINEINSVNEAPIELIGDLRAGIGITAGPIPFAFHFGYSVVVAGEVIASDNDIEYLTIIQDALIDNDLTVGEIINTVVNGDIQLITLSPILDGTLDVVDPEDVLTSEFEGTRVDRAQFGISFGFSVPVAGRPLDIGITPKISSITTFQTAGLIATEFDEDTPSIIDDFNDSENDTTTFTVDIGGTYTVSDQLAVSSVFRNLITETAETSSDLITIETTPQVIVGGVYKFSNLAVNADVALNSARRDGVVTQPLGVGIEFSRSIYSLRGGISIDNGRVSDEAALTLGFGVGPLQVGSRVSSLEAIQAGAQLSFSF